MLYVILKKPIKFAHLYKLANQSTLNKAHVTEIIKACIVALWKQEIPWLFDVERRNKKQEMVKIYFLKVLLKCFSQHQKVVYDGPSIKWTSWKDNDMLYYYIILLYIINTLYYI